jgi:CBS-domain-containing membrane protein
LPAAFLEQLMKVFCQYTPHDSSSEEHKTTMTFAFIGQANRDIRKRLQRLEELQDKSLKDLVQLLRKSTITWRQRRRRNREKERKKMKGR